MQSFYFQGLWTSVPIPLPASALGALEKNKTKHESTKWDFKNGEHGLGEDQVLRKYTLTLRYSFTCHVNKGVLYHINGIPRDMLLSGE